ncbi:uncharacterized protein ACR2FA_000867 [Aphomia sociella]
MKLIYIFVYINLIYKIKSEEKESMANKNSLPYFRRQAEEIVEDTITETTVADESHLVSILVKNVRKIFHDLYDIDSTKLSTVVETETRENQTLDTFLDHSTLLFNPNTTISTFDFNVSTPLLFSEAMLYNGNFSITTYTNIKDNNIVQSSEDFYKLTERNELMYLSKYLTFFKTDQKDLNILQNVNAFSFNTTESEFNVADSRRSCIACDNVVAEDCNDPKNKLISTTICNHDDDLCYSLHTPFGIVDRGCFNVNYNLTTYVCSCNLCNYISISEMPNIFSKKRDWIDNVVELSRTRHYRKSVFKDMSCLKCEVNITIKTGDMLDKANCLEGNIGTLSTQKCKQNEICGVKAVKGNGYIWRGCIKSPLYNYWWKFCDSDLCNYDAIVSLYDID